MQKKLRLFMFFVRALINYCVGVCTLDCGGGWVIGEGRTKGAGTEGG